MRLAITLLLAAGVALSALAQPLPRAPEDWDDIAVSRLLGRAVIDAAGADIGRVEDLIIDTSERGTHFVVVSSGGWLDLGDRHRLLPLAQLTPGTRPGSVLVELDPDRLAAVPVIEPDEWPNFETQTFWDWEPAAAGGSDEPLLVRRYVRATVALGKTLRGRDGEVVGELEDFVVNLGTGSVRYAAVELAGVAQPRQRHVAVPLGSIDFPSDRHRDLLLEIL